LRWNSNILDDGKYGTVTSKDEPEATMTNTASYEIHQERIMHMRQQREWIFIGNTVEVKVIECDTSTNQRVAAIIVQIKYDAKDIPRHVKVRSCSKTSFLDPYRRLQYKWISLESDEIFKCALSCTQDLCRTQSEIMSLAESKELQTTPVLITNKTKRVLQLTDYGIKVETPQYFSVEAETTLDTTPILPLLKQQHCLTL
jgi:hypothetical protein